jgi:hypothetical protein
MKYLTLLAMAVLAVLGSISASRADTKLLWRTARTGVSVASNLTTAVSLGRIDVSAYDRVRVVAVVRRPASVPTNRGFGFPLRIELNIAEENEDLGPLENGRLGLNPTDTSGDVPPRTVRSTAVFEYPVVTTLLVNVVGGTSTSQQTVIIDVFVYGQTSAGSTTQ